MKTNELRLSADVKKRISAAQKKYKDTRFTAEQKEHLRELYYYFEEQEKRK